MGPAGSTGGFALGTSTQDSRPVAGVEGIARFTAARDNGMSAGLTSSSPPKAGTRRDSGGGRGGINFDLTGTGNALEELSMGGGAGGMDAFIQGPGASLYESFTLHKTQLKELKQRCRDCSASVNEAKASIDRLQQSLEARKASRIELLRKSGKHASGDPYHLCFYPCFPSFVPHSILLVFFTHMYESLWYTLFAIFTHSLTHCFCFTPCLGLYALSWDILFDRIKSIRNRRHRGRRRIRFDERIARSETILQEWL